MCDDCEILREELAALRLQYALFVTEQQQLVRKLKQRVHSLERSRDLWRYRATHR